MSQTTLFVHRRERLPLRAAVGMFAKVASAQPGVALLYSPQWCRFALLGPDRQPTDAAGRAVDLSPVFEARLFNEDAELRWLNDPRGEQWHRTVILAHVDLAQKLGEGWSKDPHDIIDTLDQTYLLWGEGTGSELADGWSELATADWRDGGSSDRCRRKAEDRVAQCRVSCGNRPRQCRGFRRAVAEIGGGTWLNLFMASWSGRERAIIAFGGSSIRRRRDPYPCQPRLMRNSWTRPCAIARRRKSRSIWSCAEVSRSAFGPSANRLSLRRLGRSNLDLPLAATSTGNDRNNGRGRAAPRPSTTRKHRASKGWASCFPQSLQFRSGAAAADEPFRTWGSRTGRAPRVPC